MKINKNLFSSLKLIKAVRYKQLTAVLQTTDNRQVLCYMEKSYKVKVLVFIGWFIVIG